jgi:hypothetical protein
LLVVFELLVESSDIAQKIKDIARALSNQDYTQVRYSAYSLSTHITKVGLLLWYYVFQIRRHASFTADTDEHFDRVASPVPPSQASDTSGSELARELESGRGVPVSTVAPDLQSHDPVSDGFSPVPLEKAHIRPACTNTSRVAIDFANGSIAPPFSPELFDDNELSEPSMGFDMQDLDARHKCRSNRTASTSLPSRREFHRTAPSLRPLSTSPYAEVPAWHGLNPATVGGAFESIATVGFDTNF